MLGAQPIVLDKSITIENGLNEISTISTKEIITYVNCYTAYYI